MERFLLFEGEDYYPVGGWEDFTGSFKSVAQAQAAKKYHLYDGGWAHIVDLETGTIILYKNRDKPWAEGENKNGTD